jgi:hypothetical protein
VRIDGARIHAVEIVPDLLARVAGDLLNVLGRVTGQLTLELH